MDRFHGHSIQDDQVSPQAFRRNAVHRLVGSARGVGAAHPGAGVGGHAREFAHQVGMAGRSQGQRQGSGYKLKLKVSGKGSGSLAPLSDIAADDLHTLDLSRSEISDISLSHLEHLTGLKVLELTATNVSNEGLNYLQPLKALQGLGLSHCNISGVGLGFLQNLHDLRELWMSGAQLGDADLHTLSGLQKLVQLGMSGTQITDAGLKRLSSLRSLIRIYLFNTNVTQPGIEVFRQLVPGSRVKWKPVAQVDDSLIDVDPGTPLDELLSNLPDEVRAAFQLPLDVPAGEKNNNNAYAMPEDVFWQIIDSLDWEQAGDDSLVIEPAVKALAEKKDKEILAFADMLSERLHDLDGESYAREIGKDSYKGPDKRFSKNCFLSARCCVLANGREFHELVLEDPTQMPKDMEFEALLKIPSRAYERKTGKKLSYVTKVSYETFTNKSLWSQGNGTEPPSA